MHIKHPRLIYNSMELSKIIDMLETYHLAWHGLEMWTPQNAKDKDWPKLKNLHFYFSDPRSH